MPLSPEYRRLFPLLLLLAMAGGFAFWSRSRLPAPVFRDPVDLSQARVTPLAWWSSGKPMPPVLVLRPEPAMAASWSDYLAEMLVMEGIGLARLPCGELKAALTQSLSALVLRPGCPSLPIEALKAYVARGGVVVGVLDDVLAQRDGLEPAFATLFGVRTLPGRAHDVAKSPELGSSQGPQQASPLFFSERIGAGTLIPVLPLEEADTQTVDRARPRMPQGAGAGGLEGTHTQTGDIARLRMPKRAGTGDPKKDTTQTVNRTPQHNRGTVNAGPVLLESHLGPGRLSLITADLPRTVARTRQGDPRLADRAHLLPNPCPADLLQANYHPERYTRPVADGFMHWLVSLLDAGSFPAPSLWPFPSPRAGVVIMTGDQDYADDELVQYELDRVADARGEMTLFLTANTRRRQTDPLEAHNGGGPEGPTVARWSAMHHGISIHPNANGVPRTGAALTTVIRSARDQQVRRFGLFPRTIRHHFVFWWGYTAAAQALADLGVLMDLNYSSIVPGAAGHGYLSGAGLPLPFVTSAGRVLPIYQQPTPIEDSLLLGDYDFSARLSEAEALVKAEQLIREATQHGTAVAINIHPLYAVKAPKLLVGLLQAANEAALPIISAERWLGWVLGRRTSRMEGLVWSRDALEFDLAASMKQWIRIPLHPNQRGIQGVTVDGQPVPHHLADGPLPGWLISVPAGDHRVHVRYDQ